jgi:hypothetical protein
LPVLPDGKWRQENRPNTSQVSQSAKQMQVLIWLKS